MGSRSRPPLYAPVDAALFRAVAAPGMSAMATATASWPGTDCTAVDRWSAWWSEIWALPAVAAAVEIASPVLADRVEDICHGRRPSARQACRLGLAVARYLARMSRRPTPFGLFAGVGPARFGAESARRWAGSDRPYPRADSVWLAAIIARLESMPEVRAVLTVTANDLAVVRGERLVMPWRPHGHPPTETFLPAEVSVRHGRAVKAAMTSAASPIRFVDVVDALATELDLPVANVEQFVAGLLAHGVLVSGLRPPATCTDGLAHLLRALNGVEYGHEQPAVERPADDPREDPARIVGELRMIQAELTTLRDADEAPTGRSLAAVGERMRAMCRVVEQPLAVDLRLGREVVLPELVALEAAAAAAALRRLTPYPAGNTSWRDYHRAFLDRFGASSLVRLAQLVDPVVGLGYPAHFSPPTPAAAGVSHRDAGLLRLVQRAALHGEQEVVLDDAALDALCGPAPGGSPEPHVEICGEVLAPTVAALSRGAFSFLVTGVSRTAAAMSGRFLDVLPDADRLRMISAFRQLPPIVEGAVAAQLSFPPAHVRLENVTRTLPVLEDWISLAEHRGGQRRGLLWTDLAVAADDEGFYLVSLSRRAVIEPLLTHAAARHTFPPLARLLHELPRAGLGAVAPFSWGAADCLPRLPRVRHGRVVLAPARWHIEPSDLPDPAAGERDWDDALTRLRGRSGLPRWVTTGRADLLLRLDLDERMDRDLLRAELDRAGEAVSLFEAPEPADYGWADGRAHEVVVPVATTAAPRPAPAVITTSGPLLVADPAAGMLPGSALLFAKLYCHPDVIDTILTGHLPALLDAWDIPPRWWFVRYRDPAPHLRLRLHLDPPGSTDDYGLAALRVGAWAEQLRDRHLIGDLVLDTYHPETARYGDGEALAAAEALFAADSAAVVAQLAAHADNRALYPAAVTAVSLVDLTCAFLGGIRAGMRWLLDNHRASGAPTQRPVLRQAIALARAHSGRSAPDAGIPHLPAPVCSAWNTRREAAERYALQLAASPRQQSSAEVLGSLLHLHHVRAHGIDSAAERDGNRLARAVALAWTNADRQTEPDPVGAARP